MDAVHSTLSRFRAQEREVRSLRLRQARASGQPIRLRIISPSDSEKDQCTQLQWSDHWIKYELIKALGQLPDLILTEQQPHAILHLLGFPTALDPRIYTLGWIYGHPDMQTDFELAQYDHLFCYSLPFRRELERRGFYSELLIGATGKLPHPWVETRYPATFVGNARPGGGSRPAVEALLATGEPFLLWGKGWERHVPQKCLGGSYFDYQRLEELYAASDCVLNDHHPDMARWGFVSFRLFDVLAAGGFAISETNCGIEGIFGDTVPQFSDGRQLAEIMAHFRAHPEEKRRLRAEGMNIALSHSWEARALQIWRFLMKEADPGWKEPPKISEEILRKRGELVNERSRQQEILRSGRLASGGRSAISVPVGASAANVQNGHETESRDWFHQPVIIVGFHHSGTRLLAQLLHKMGVFQIPDDQKTYEWKYVQDLNMEILPRWYDPRAVRAFDPAVGAEKIQPSAIFDRLKEQGYDGAGPWLHKDPRSCTTIASWLRVFPQARMLHIIRDPLDVLGTIPSNYANYTPGGALPQEALPFWANLWESYLERIREAARFAAHFAEVRFEDLCLCPETELERLAKELELNHLEAPVIEGIDIGKIGLHRQWVTEGKLDGAAVEEMRIRLAGPRRQYGYSDNDAVPVEIVPDDEPMMA